MWPELLMRNNVNIERVTRPYVTYSPPVEEVDTCTGTVAERTKGSSVTQ